MNNIFFLVPALMLIFTVSLAPAYAQSDSIPEWIKGVVVFWADGNITDLEFIEALQFLIESGVIKIDHSLPVPIAPVPVAPVPVAPVPVAPVPDTIPGVDITYRDNGTIFYERTYYENGNVKSYDVYHESGAIDYEIIYDEDGNKKSIISYFENGAISAETTNHENGNLISVD